MSALEVPEVLQLTSEAVRIRLHRARGALRSRSASEKKCRGSFSSPGGAATASSSAFEKLALALNPRRCDGALSCAEEAYVWCGS